MRQLTKADYEAFVTAKPAAAVHFDADWDVSGLPLTRPKMIEAEEALGEQANFGEVNIDNESDLANLIPVLNIPLVAYYRNGKLVAALIGMGQNVRGRVERVLRGEPIGRKDGT